MTIKEFHEALKNKKISAREATISYLDRIKKENGKLNAYLEVFEQGALLQAKEIVKQVENLGKHLGNYDEYMQKMGKNLGTTVSMYTNAYKEFKKIDKDVLKISEGRVKMDIEPMSLEGPKEE